MMGRLKLAVFISLLAVMSVCASLTHAMSVEVQNLYDRGRFELADGQYEAALSFFNEALQLAPDNKNVLFSRGQALVKLKRYDEAEAQFKAIDDPATDIELGALYGQTNRYGEAAAAYTRALQSFPQRADLYLARGAVYMKDRRYDKAEADFAEARRVDPNLEASSYFYQGVLNFRRGDYDQSMSYLDRAEAADPRAGLRKQITEYKNAVKREKKARKWWAVTVQALAQYDSNVSQEPLDGWGEALEGSAPSDQEDVAVGFNGAFTAYLINKRVMQLGGEYAFRSLFYGHLEQNDLLSHTLSLFFNMNRDPWFFGVRTSAGYYYADYDDELALYAVNPFVSYLWRPADRTELIGWYEYRAMQDGTDDAKRGILNLTHYHTLFGAQPGQASGWVVRGGANYEWENSTGDDGVSYDLYGVETGLSFPLPWKLVGDVGLGYAWVNYDENDNIDPDESREDGRLTATASLGRAITDYLRADLYYSYTHNDSNLSNMDDIDLYEFDRHVVTFVLTGSF